MAGWAFLNLHTLPRAPVASGLVVQVVWNGLGTGLALSGTACASSGYGRHCLCWNAERTSSQLSTDFCLLQGKRHREAEGSKSSRRPSNRSPTSAEKRMSFESVSSLPEVSSQPGRELEHTVPGSQISRSIGRSSEHKLSHWHMEQGILTSWSFPHPETWTA